MLKEGLERRFSSLMKQRSQAHVNFFIAELGYVRYISENEHIAKLVERIILEERMSKPAIKEIFNTFSFAIGLDDFDEEKFRFPLFWSDDLEKKYNLKREYTEMVQSYKKSSQIDRKNWLDKKRDEEYLLTIIQQLHNDLLDKIDEETLMNIEGEDGKSEKQIGNNGELKQIQNIIVVKETQRTNRFIIVNKKYDEAIEIKGGNFSRHIKALAEAIVNGTGILETYDGVQCRDFLNSNSGCRLYRSKDGKKINYSKTKITEFNSRYTGRKLEIANDVQTETITNTTYLRRLNEFHKNQT